MKGWKQKRQTVCVAVFMTLLLCSCDSVPKDYAGDSLSNRTNVLRYDVNIPFNSLNPNTEEVSGSDYIYPLLYSYLFVPDEKGNLEPDLAIDWVIDLKNRTGTLTLREGARFHNNQLVTSQDVKYSIESMFENRIPEYRSKVRKISCPSDLVVLIQFDEADTFLLHQLWTIEIVPQADGKEIDYYHHPIGSGPFKFKSRKENELVVLEANEQYYGRRPSLYEVVYFYQPNREKSWVRLLRGETDIAHEIVHKNYEMMRQYKDRFYFDRFVLDFCTILLFNTFDPLFKDPKVRMALSLSIDRRHIVDEILKGYGVVGDGPMGVDSPYRNLRVEPIHHDPGRALKLLTKAGWFRDKNGRLLSKEGEPFEFTLLIFKESQIEKLIARYIQLCFNEIGVRMHVKPLSFQKILGSYTKNTSFQAVLTEAQTNFSNPLPMIRLWSPALTGNSVLGCFQDPKVTHLLLEASKPENYERQVSLLREVDALMKSLQPGVFLFQKTAIDVMSKRIDLSEPFSLKKRGIYSLRNASVFEK